MPRRAVFHAAPRQVQRQRPCGAAQSRFGRSDATDDHRPQVTGPRSQAPCRATRQTDPLTT
jgi:hypothetical protein